MSRKVLKRAQKKTAANDFIEAYREASLAEDREREVAKVADNDLFFVDTEGHLNSRRNQKLRKRLELEQQVSGATSSGGKKRKESSVEDIVASVFAPVDIRTKQERVESTRASKASSSRRTHRVGPKPSAIPIPDLDETAIPKALFTVEHHSFLRPSGQDRDLWDDSEQIKEQKKFSQNNMDFLRGMVENKLKNRRNPHTHKAAKHGPTRVAPSGLSINPRPEDHYELMKTAAERFVSSQ